MAMHEGGGVASREKKRETQLLFYVCLVFCRVKLGLESVFSVAMAIPTLCAIDVLPIISHYLLHQNKVGAF